MSSQHSESMEGTARLWVAVPVAVASFFYVNILEYSLPLYFDALRELAEMEGGNFPKDTWSNLIKFKVTFWIFGSAFAGLLARRYGERIVWGIALLGKVIVMLGLIYYPTPMVIKVLSAWQGFTGALMWIAGISLIQMVPLKRKGISNAMMMMSLGIGSLVGAFLGRSMIYRHELNPLVFNGNWAGFASRLFNFTPLTSTPTTSDFMAIFWMLIFMTLVSSISISLWGQRPGRFGRDDPPDWATTFRDIRVLAGNAKFWALVIPLALFGGPVFQASNQFLPYRAEELGLKVGSEDHGWIWLQLLKTLMWIPGGAAVGFLAGRRASGFAGAVMLGSFSLAAVGIGVSGTAWQIFLCVAWFEFTRQFMRWSHAGYISEHMPGHLRATAIGCAIMFSGLGSAIYSWIAPEIWDIRDIDFESWPPVVVAGVAGSVGAVGLFVYDRIWPIRSRNGTKDDA